MDEQFIRDRISFLRTQKGISEYKMSLDLGHSKSYIQSISNGRALPSLAEFLYICDYLGVTPQEFFDTDCETPQLAHELRSSNHNGKANKSKMNAECNFQCCTRRSLI